VSHTVIPALGRQMHHELKASLHYITKAFLKEKKVGTYSGPREQSVEV
jgi:hypothetical protein